MNSVAFDAGGLEPPKWRSYSSLFRGSRDAVRRLRRHLAGRGLSTLESDVDAIREMSGALARRLESERAHYADHSVILHTLRYLQSSLDRFVAIVKSNSFDMGEALAAWETIDQQVENVCRMIAIVDRGERGSLLI